MSLASSSISLTKLTLLNIQMLRDKFLISHNNKSFKIPFSDVISFSICRNHNDVMDDLQIEFFANERFNDFLIDDEKVDGRFAHCIDYIFDEYLFKNKTLDNINPFSGINKLTFIEIRSEDENGFIVHYVNVNHLHNFCFELDEKRDKWELTI